MNRPPTSHLVLLVAAPTVALAARLLNTPWYQNADDTPDNARVLAEVADHTVRNDVGAVLTLVSGLLYLLAAAVLWSLVRPRMRRTADAGLGLAGVGAFGLAVFADQLMTLGQAARLEEHRDGMVDLLQAVYDSPQAGLSYLLLVLGAAGWIALAVCAYRARTGSRAAAVVTGLGGAGVMLTAPGPAIAFIAGSAAISLVGLAWLAIGVVRNASPADADRLREELARSRP